MKTIKFTSHGLYWFYIGYCLKNILNNIFLLWPEILIYLSDSFSFNVVTPYGHQKFANGFTKLRIGHPLLKVWHLREHPLESTDLNSKYYALFSAEYIWQKSSFQPQIPKWCHSIKKTTFLKFYQSH